MDDCFLCKISTCMLCELKILTVFLSKKGLEDFGHYHLKNMTA